MKTYFRNIFIAEDILMRSVSRSENNKFYQKIKYPNWKVTIKDLENIVGLVIVSNDAIYLITIHNMDFINLGELNFVLHLF